MTKKISATPFPVFVREIKPGLFGLPYDISPHDVKTISDTLEKIVSPGICVTEDTRQLLLAQVGDESRQPIVPNIDRQIVRIATIIGRKRNRCDNCLNRRICVVPPEKAEKRNAIPLMQAISNIMNDFREWNNNSIDISILNTILSVKFRDNDICITELQQEYIKTLLIQPLRALQKRKSDDFQKHIEQTISLIDSTRIDCQYCLNSGCEKRAPARK
jgi:hypothetical protein